MKKITFSPVEDENVFVNAYLHETLPEITNFRNKFPAVVICPGGGYVFLSEREADPVALRYFAAGYNVFILYYSVGEKAVDFRPLKELSETVIAIRKNATEWLVNTDKIAVCGFSAGGHLAASLGTLWNHPDFLKNYDMQAGLNQPNAMILSYPVITADERFAHRSSIETVSGSVLGTDKANFFSLENRVSKSTVPTFIWHTVEDTTVPIENSIRFISALQEHGIPYECHFFPTGGHGMSVCTEEVASFDSYNARWMDFSIQWLNKTFCVQL